MHPLPDPQPYPDGQGVHVEVHGVPKEHGEGGGLTVKVYGRYMYMSQLDYTPVMSPTPANLNRRKFWGQRSPV